MNIKVIILLLSAIKQNFSSIAENSDDSHSEKCWARISFDEK